MLSNKSCEPFFRVDRRGSMKAITIIQPWATLIALREKKFETRSFPNDKPEKEIEQRRS